MSDRIFDIFVNNVPARLLFSEVDKRVPTIGVKLRTELKSALEPVFNRNLLKEAVEFVKDTPVVRVLEVKEFKKKRKSYNPKSEVYDLLTNFVQRTKSGRADTLTWWVNGVNLATELPELRAVFRKAHIYVRFVPAGETEGISEEDLQKAVEAIVSNFIGEAETDDESEAKPRRAEPRRAKGPECDAILSKASISSRKEFLRWALRNHPDKGGNTEIFQRVSACVDRQYGSGRTTRRRQTKRRQTRKQRK